VFTFGFNYILFPQDFIDYIAAITDDFSYGIMLSFSLFFERKVNERPKDFSLVTYVSLEYSLTKMISK